MLLANAVWYLPTLLESVEVHDEVACRKPGARKAESSTFRTIEYCTSSPFLLSRVLDSCVGNGVRLRYFRIALGYCSSVVQYCTAYHRHHVGDCPHVLSSPKSR